MNSRTVVASSSVPGAPATNGATGLPYRQRLSAYQSPPITAAQPATTAASRNGRSRRSTSGQTAAASATAAPGYFAPAAMPANTPADASPLIPDRRVKHSATAAVAPSSSRSSFAEGI